MKIDGIELVKNGFIAGIISFIISAILNYFVLPFPKNLIGNAVNHGTGGFFCGFFSAIIGIIIYTVNVTRKSDLPKAHIETLASVKNIVITGASKGLGRELAIKLSQKNHNLILLARNRDGLESVQKEIYTQTGKCPLIVPCDISEENEIGNLSNIIREKYQHVDVLINNAGIGVTKILEMMNNGEMRRQFETNCFGAIYCIKVLLPLLKSSPSAYILNIGSLLSKVSYAQTSIYSATKFALLGFTEGFRSEMKKSNIKVGFFMSGPMNTSFHNKEEGSFLAPELLTLNLMKVAGVIEKMIYKRKENVFMYRWMLWLMKIKQFLQH